MIAPDRTDQAGDPAHDVREYRSPSRPPGDDEVLAPALTRACGVPVWVDWGTFVSGLKNTRGSRSAVDGQKTMLFIPTYNERDNVERMHSELRALGLTLDVLFVDDSSPDGTGAILDALAARDLHLRVIHRPSRQGVGSAHLEGIRYARANSYTVLITMDCDFTHPPSVVPEFLREAENADLVLGSRFRRRDSLREWSLLRKLLARTGHLLIKYMLRVPFDATGAFRLYRLDRIDPAIFERVASRGYSFFFESLYLLCRSDLRVAEIPIDVPRRASGRSKMTVWDALTSVRMLFVVWLRSLREPPLPDPYLRSRGPRAESEVARPGPG